MLSTTIWLFLLLICGVNLADFDVCCLVKVSNGPMLCISSIKNANLMKWGLDQSPSTFYNSALIIFTDICSWMQGTFQALYQICSLCSFLPHLLDFFPSILSCTLYNEIMPDLLDVWQLLITKQLRLLLAFFFFFFAASFIFLHCWCNNGWQCGKHPLLWSPLLWASHIPSNRASNGHKKLFWEIP